jgi:quercetin dioxygenase-like cupin family protein
VSGVTRRVVTGHRPDGRSVVVSDAAVPHVRGVPGARFDEVWSTAATPERLDLAPANEPTSKTPSIGPQSGGGSLIRIIEFAPVGDGGMCSPMHRTRTIDYGIVIEGEVVLILSDSEVVLKAGDVVIQRGTDHAWENRSAKTARMAFILLGAEFAPELASLLEGQELMP